MALTVRGQRCLEDINNFWMAHTPQTMSELYSHLHERIDLRLEEAQRVGYGFALPQVDATQVDVAPIAPSFSPEEEVKVAA